jgi:hypothetical protein
MKTPGTLLVLGLTAYGLWCYSSPDYSKTPVAAPSAKAVAPPPIQMVPEVPTVPDLERIALKNGTVLTHAKVKAVQANGILFLCDQGLMKIPFANLPTDLADYYKPMVDVAIVPADAPSIVSTAPAATVAPVDVPAPVAPPAPPPRVAPQVQRTVLQDAQDNLEFTVARNSLKDRIKADQELITNRYRQSTFENSAISESQFTAAKADLDAAMVQLGQLDANGPGG